MSASPSDIDIIATVRQYVNYVYIVILITGIIGNTLNTLVFINLKIFHRNQCAFYLIVESMINIATIIYTFTDNITHYADGSDLADYSLVWCKLRFGLDQMLQLIPFSIICMAAFDQILSTSHIYSIRQISTLKLAQRMVFVVICCAIIQSTPVMFLMNIFPPIGCFTSDEKAIYYYLFFYYPILVGILPISISSLFSLIAFRNVRHLVRRQVPVVRRRLDRQLTAMVFMRVIVLVVFYSPYVIYRVYTLKLLASSNYNIPFLIDQLLQISVVLLKDINYAITFYIFLATSSRFRHQVKYFLRKKCLRQVNKWCHLSQNRIQPAIEIRVITESE